MWSFGVSSVTVKSIINPVSKVKTDVQSVFKIKSDTSKCLLHFPKKGSIKKDMSNVFLTHKKQT